MRESEIDIFERTACSVVSVADSGKVSRLDIWILIDVAVGDFVMLANSDHCVTKFRCFEMQSTGKRFTCFKIGSKAFIDLRFYDARRRTEWNGRSHDIGIEWLESDKPVTCVAFRLYRKSLKELGVESINDFRERQFVIVDCLTHDCFRILAEPKVRGTENRAEIHPLWKRIRHLLFIASGNTLNERSD